MVRSIKLKNILNNKYVLYAVVFIALTNVVGYISVGDYDSLIFFCVIGLLSSYFSKNMIINLLVSILATNIAFTNDRVYEYKVREGLKNKKETLTPKRKKKEGLEDAGKKKKEKYTQKNVPPSVPSPATESEEDEAVGKRIDYASTMEKAYDNLSKMLGPNGLNGLSAETKKLAAQQKGLLENLNNMAPVIQTARKTLDSLGGNMPNLENLQSIMEKFGTIVGGKK